MKKQIILICFLYPLLTIGQANKLIRKGLKSDDSNEKIKLFTEAIALDDKNLDAYFYRGFTKHNIGDYNGAILDYTKVIFYEPSADVYFNRGNSKYSLMDYYGAIDDYANALKLNPEFIEARYSSAVTKNDLKDYKGAIADLDLINVAKSAPIFLQIARAFTGLKDYKNALKNYDLAILLTPHTDTYYARGVFYMNVNYFKKANADFNAALYLDRNNIPAYFFRGISSFFLGKYEDSLYDFSIAVKADIADFDALIGLALVHYKLNDFEKAQANFTKAKSILKDGNVSLKDNLDLFKNTYWYQNQYYSFRELCAEINKI